MLRSLVGSEMCIRDRKGSFRKRPKTPQTSEVVYIKVRESPRSRSRATSSSTAETAGWRLSTKADGRRSRSFAWSGSAASFGPVNNRLRRPYYFEVALSDRISTRTELHCLYVNEILMRLIQQRVVGAPARSSLFPPRSFLHVVWQPSWQFLCVTSLVCLSLIHI